MLKDDIEKATTNLANSVKALKIATQQLREAADRLDKKPKLVVIKGDKKE